MMTNPDWDNRDVLTQHLSGFPSPYPNIQSILHPLQVALLVLNLSTSHYTNFLLPLSSVLSLRGECKHSDRCIGH